MKYRSDRCRRTLPLIESQRAGMLELHLEREATVSVTTRLAEGRFADVTIFDVASIADHATYDEPSKPSTGVSDVTVNGSPIVRDGREVQFHIALGRALRYHGRMN